MTQYRKLASVAALVASMSVIGAGSASAQNSPTTGAGATTTAGQTYGGNTEQRDDDGPDMGWLGLLGLAGLLGLRRRREHVDTTTTRPPRV